MPKQPFEIGGGVVKLNDQEVDAFFDAAETSVIEVLGIDEKTMAACKDRLEDDGTYFKLQATVIWDGYAIIGSVISAEVFVPNTEQDELEEEIVEVEDEFLSFTGRFVELRFNNIDNMFHRVEGPARLVLDVMGDIHIEEGIGVINVNDGEGENGEAGVESGLVEARDGLNELLDVDSRTPKVEDYMMLNGVVIKLKVEK